MQHRIKMAALALALVGAGVVAGGESALAIQGHMFAAQGDLQSAQTELNNAIPDKAGHRIAALNFISRAMNQVRLGIAAGAQ